MARSGAHWRRKQRREDAEVRQEARNKMTDQQQLEELDRRFGPGLGAKKERARLQQRISAVAAAKSKKKQQQKDEETE